MSCLFCHSDNPSAAEFCRACGAELPLLNGGADANIGADALVVASADALAVGSLLAGVYAVERVLGQGGFGITYGCHDQMLDRRVAIKEFFPSGCRREGATVRPSRGVSETHFGEALAQFLAEARLLARCHHAGIVGVHTAFEANSTAYMVMELLHGSSLDRLTEARGGRLSESEAVRLTERAGEALQFVHDQGLLHRDIKPENIIATDDGRVMLIDFGTAREYAQGQAQGHTIVVTPGYAPLEQYARQAKRGAFTDVYGLAATLYHLLTGAAPPAASDRAVGVMLRPVREENAQISASVASAIEAGLEMEIAKRPQSVREFLELMHAPATSAPHEKAAFEIALAPQENAVAKVELSTVAYASGPSPSYQNALQARQKMLEDIRSAPAPVQLASPSVLSIPMASSASSTLSAGAGGGFIAQNSAAVDDPMRSTNRVAGIVVVVIGLLCVLFVILGQRYETQSRESSISYPSGFQPSSSYPSASYPATRIYEPSVPPVATHLTAAEAARREVESTPAILPASVERLPVSAPLSAKDVGKVPFYVSQGVAGFSPDGQRLAYVDSKSVVRVWDLSKRRAVRSLPLFENHPPSRLFFSRDGKSLVVIYQDQVSTGPNQVRVWNLRTGKAQGTLSVDPRKEWLNPQAMLPDGKVYIFKASRPASQNQFSGTTGWLWNPISGEETFSSKWQIGDLRQAVVSPDGKQIVVGDKTGGTAWFDVRTGKQQGYHSTRLTYQDFQDSPFKHPSQTIPGGSNLSDLLAVSELRFSGDGSALASRNEMEISVFDSKAREIGTVAAGNSPTLAISTDGKFLAEGGNWDAPERKMLWDVGAKRKIRLQAPDGRLSAVTFSPDGKQIIGLCSSGGPPSLVTWNTDTKPVTPFLAPQTGVLPGVPRPLATFLSPTSQLLATLTSNSIEIRQLDGTLTQNIYTGYLNGRGVALSLDGASVAAELDNGAVQIWDVQTTQKKSQLEPIKSSQGAAPSNIAEGLTGAVRFTQSKRLIFSPDNNFLAHLRTIEGKNSVELWSLQGTPRPIGAIALNEPATALTFSSDNRGLICGGKSGVVRWYDVATRTLSAQIKGEFGEVFHLVASPRELAVVEGNDSGALVTGYDVRLRNGKPNQNQTEPSPLQTPKLFLRETSRLRLDDVDISLGMALSTDRGSLISVHGFDGTNGSLDVWDLITGVKTQQLYFDPTNFDMTSGMMSWATIGAISFSPDGNQISCLRGYTNKKIRDERQVITWKRAPK